MSKQLMKGNEALAEAALRAGCRFYSGYPITPQTEILEYLAKRMDEVGGTFVQTAVLAFVPMILVAIGCYFFGVQMKKRQTARQEAFSFLSDKVQESISGIRVLKAFVQEKKDLEDKVSFLAA